MEEEKITVKHAPVFAELQMLILQQKEKHLHLQISICGSSRQNFLFFIFIFLNRLARQGKVVSGLGQMRLVIGRKMILGFGRLFSRKRQVLYARCFVTFPSQLVEHCSGCHRWRGPS